MPVGFDGVDSVDGLVEKRAGDVDQKRHSRMDRVGRLRRRGRAPLLLLACLPCECHLNVRLCENFLQLFLNRGFGLVERHALHLNSPVCRAESQGSGRFDQEVTVDGLIDYRAEDSHLQNVPDADLIGRFRQHGFPPRFSSFRRRDLHFGILQDFLEMFHDLSLGLLARQAADIRPPIRGPERDLAAGLDKIEAVDGLILDGSDGAHRKNVPDTDFVRKARKKG